MSRVDYREYKIKPGRNWDWAKAIQYLLQSEENIVASEQTDPAWRGPHLYLFRINTGVLEYKSVSNGEFPDELSWVAAVRWGQREHKRFYAFDGEAEWGFPTNRKKIFPPSEVDYLERRVADLEKRLANENKDSQDLDGGK